MKILMVSSFLPYPLTSGGNIRLYNLLKNLSKKYEVTLICEKREYQTGKDVNEVGKFCKKITTVARIKQWSPSNILKSAFSFSPFLVVGHTNSKMKQIVESELEKENYDLIHVETFYVMQNLPKTSLPIVLVEHNIEYSVYKKFVDHSTFFLKPFLSWDVWKSKTIEEKFWKKAKVLVAVSQKEKEIMKADLIVSNGVDIDKFELQNSKSKFNQKEKLILFIGDFRWIENKDTAKWIIEKIWPKIKIQNSILNVKLWVVGKNIPNKLKSLSKDPDIIFDENAPKDTSLIYRKSFLLLSPIRIGGGTSFKILEAMSCGVPVVTTSLGAEGITNGNELIKADTVDEITESVDKLLTDQNYYENITKYARALIEEKYNWKDISKKLEGAYRMALK